MISTIHTKTELEYAIDLKTILDIHHIKRSEIEGAIISSVVPQITICSEDLRCEKILKKDTDGCRTRSQDRTEYCSG